MKAFKNIIQKINLSILYVLILVFVDLFTKTIFTGKVYLENSFLYINYHENTGSAFSMFSNVSYYNYFIIILSIIVIFYLYKNKENLFSNLNNFSQLPYILIQAGMLGNLIDRVFLGYVRDFIGVKFFSIFNLADSYLTIAILILIYLEFKKKK